jgi:putative alpha-1,2-mannosidase
MHERQTVRRREYEVLWASMTTSERLGLVRLGYPAGSLNF